MKKKISVIIPVYNVEKYISRCIDSILNQSYNNIEIIIVNDGSIDKSGFICDEYSKKYNNIKVFHTENSGVSSARNLGIDNSEGEYITFVDPDDYIEKDMYKILYDLIIKSKSEIAMTSFYYIKENDVIEAEDNSNNLIIFTKEEALRLYFKREKPFDSCFLWNKLFKRDLFKEVRLDVELVIQEDSEVLIRLLNRINSIVYIGIPLYFYIIREGAATYGKISKNKLTTDISLLKIYRYTQEYLPAYSSVALSNYIICYFNIVIEIIKNYDEYGKCYEIIVRRLKDIYYEIMRDKKIVYKYKLHSTLILLNRKLYRLYIKTRIKKRGGDFNG